MWRNKVFGRLRWSSLVLALVATFAAAALVVLMISVARLTVHADKLDRRLDDAQKARVHLQRTMNKQDAALAEANRRLRAAGKQQVKVPASPAPTTGSSGATGPQGPRGLSCVDSLGLMPCRGPRGFTGADGKKGAPGPRGLTGATGPAGTPGAQGAAGDTGPAGPQGPAGPKGDKGEPGLSAFPFTFTFTVLNNPIQSTTYTVTCTVDGCTVTTSD